MIDFPNKKYNIIYADPPLFWALVAYGGTGCWEWQGTCFSSGYGRIGDLRASRVVDNVLNGVLPAHLLVLHKCDNRRCVRPTHLYRGTHEQNMQDMRVRERQARGARCHSSKLSEVDILAIRAEYKERRTRQVDLAARYGVTQATISRILLHKKWAWL